MIISQVYLSGLSGRTYPAYRGYYKVQGYDVYFRVPGRDSLMKDFHVVLQHCSQKGIAYESVEPVQILLLENGFIEVSEAKTEPEKNNA